MDVGKVCEVTRLPPVPWEAANTIKEFAMDKTWAQLADPGEELPETKPVSGNAYTYCHIVPTNQSTAKSAPREPHFRRYSVSRRELGDTDVFVPKRALKQRLGKGQR